MKTFKNFFNLKEGFGEGGDTPIGVLPWLSTKKSKKSKTESGVSGALLGRSDFTGMHFESGFPKFNKNAEHGGMNFYSPHERKK
jgi:hypothetical protein